MKKSVPSSPASLKHLLGVYLFILVAWGFYRLLFRLPPDIEEILLKPLIWLSPLIYVLYKENASLATLGWNTKNLFHSLYLALGLGIIFALEGLVINYLKYGSFDFASIWSVPQSFYHAILLSLISAISEETVFRGYLFNRLWHLSRNEIGANFVTSLAWTIIHLPVAVLITKYPFDQLIIYLFLVFIFGIGSSVLFARSKNIVFPVLLHVLWSWPILLFR